MSTTETIDAADIKSMVQRRVGISPEQLSEAVLREAECWNHVCVLPEPFNERVSYLGDTLVQMLCKSSPKDDNLRATVGQLCQALSYMLNSASWRDGELYDFDALELRLKLRRFARSETP